jgi:DNA topoisomerase-6 subunit B
MSRGQQGIGISAAGMYGQLTTGGATQIFSRTGGNRPAHCIEVHIDTRKNAPVILKDEEVDWRPQFHSMTADGKPAEPVTSPHGTCVSIEMTASYVRGRLSVDEYLKQCAVVNPHLELHYRVILTKNGKDEDGGAAGDAAETAPAGEETPWITFRRATRDIPDPPHEIKPHPHGVELGLLIQMLKDTPSRTLRGMLTEDFSRVSSQTAFQICEHAGLNPKANPTRIAHHESEALFKAIGDIKLMRPPTDCLSPIGEPAIVAGLQKEVAAAFCTAVTRPPAVYRGNPFQIEVGLACTRPGESDEEGGADEPVRVMRFANRVPLLHMAGACAITKAVTGVNWKSYGLAQPRGALPVGPVVIMVHMASVWVPFTSESKDAVAHYPEIIREMTFALQECGRRLSVFLHKRSRLAEAERKRNYMVLYIPHLAIGLKAILGLSDRQESAVVDNLNKMLERTHLDA